MGGPTATVFLKQKATVAQLVDFEKMLSEISEQVTHTRKGRVWIVVISNGPKLETRVYDIFLEETQSRQGLHEEELLELGYLPNDLPEVITFSSEVNHSEDYELLNKLCENTLSIFEGISTEPTK
jgi:hypothetical protein